MCSSAGRRHRQASQPTPDMADGRRLRLCSHDELPQYVPADICQLAVSALVQVGQPHGRIAVLRLDFP